MDSVKQNKKILLEKKNKLKKIVLILHEYIFFMERVHVHFSSNLPTLHICVQSRIFLGIVIQIYCNICK